MSLLNRYPVKIYRFGSKLKRFVGRPPTLETLEDRTLLSTCHVTRLTDHGIGFGFRGDFRYCINKVNVNPGPDVINFHVTGTINLTSWLPNLISDIDIQGPGADLLTVRRNTGGSYRIFKVPSWATVQVSGLTISNGNPGDGSPDFTPFGGGIYNAGQFTLRDSVVSDNRVEGTYVGGGGIVNLASGVMTIDNCTISGNVAEDFIEDYAIGGGIYNLGTLTVTDSTISGNSVTAPISGAVGGGIANLGSLLVSNSIIAGNTAYSDDGSGGLGGGIYNPSPGHLTVHNSTVSGNQGAGGGVHGTIFSLRNTVVAGNTNWGGPSGKDLSGTIVTSGHNLIGNSLGGMGYGPTDILNANPLLGPLAPNGGPTLTMALLPGSPAIDAGDNTDAPDWDQRGPGYPRIVNSTIDIGAFEVQATGAPSPADFMAWLIMAELTNDDIRGRLAYWR